MHVATVLKTPVCSLMTVAVFTGKRGACRSIFRETVPLSSACCMLHAACCPLVVACRTLHVARCMLHAACCTLHVARCMLHAAFCMLHAASCTLHVAWPTLCVGCGCLKVLARCRENLANLDAAKRARLASDAAAITLCKAAQKNRSVGDEPSKLELTFRPCAGVLFSSASRAGSTSCLSLFWSRRRMPPRRMKLRTRTAARETLHVKGSNLANTRANTAG